MLSKGQLISKVLLDVLNSSKLPMENSTYSTHTIRKSSKMDGAKYIPNFAFKWW